MNISVNDESYDASYYTDNTQLSVNRHHSDALKFLFLYSVTQLVANLTLSLFLQTVPDCVTVIRYTLKPWIENKYKNNYNNVILK